MQADLSLGMAHVVSEGKFPHTMVKFFTKKCHVGTNLHNHYPKAYFCTNTTPAPDQKGIQIYLFFFISA